MRFIYQILLGLVLLNTMLVLFAGFFPNSEVYSDEAVNASEEYSDYKNPGDVFGILFPSDDITDYGAAAAILLLIASASGLIGYFVGGGAQNAALGLGIGLFISFIGIIWSNTYQVITNISPDNYIVTGIVNVTTIGIGIIVAYTLIEFFTGGRGAD